ncbi:cobalamin biosynthesis protein P47K [Leptotrichia sp. OH3620_COT-345]|uniref:GTP-binding protein n=1 Tax=Leptotrichia sp. OH3620_COT-345 TaxID=2491048 RepID=UPI000F654DA9|nr:GTP-binding protein [Leptotrichia sp. OH3620_COT-345]RRD39002.1 cobalamin biosynthesis protein P47K [Leptotrichia sp. OH3620_COT-345]
MKVFILSGFLGAGKTTFIKQMIKSTGREYVIFENEFGDVNIDGEILKTDVENDSKNMEIKVWEMTSGCVCCSTRADFLSSLLVIDNTLNPDFLVVEPSGIAVLSNILNNINKIKYECIKLLPPLTIVDVNTYFKYKSKYGEIFIDQIKEAARIQFSKIENISAEEIELICKDIKSLNTNAKIYKTDYKKQKIEYWNELFEGELIKFENNDIIEIKDKMQNMSYKNAYVNNIGELVLFLDKIVFGYFGDINRAKGVFKTHGYNLHFDVVDTEYNISFSNGNEENNTVFIGKYIDKKKLKKELESFFL